MITTNFNKMAYLIMVCPGTNNNKFYRMIQPQGESYFTVEYGRIGSKGMQRKYPMNQWYDKYQEKIKKGYLDRSDTQSISVEDVYGEYKPIANQVIQQFVSNLLAWANKKIRQSYTIKIEEVTPEMLEEAQHCINALYNCESVTSFNNSLVNLFTVLPRKMQKVSDFLIQNMSEQIAVIDREQDLLNTMQGQVSIRQKERNHTFETDKTILETYGLEITEANGKEQEEVLEHMGIKAAHVKKVYKVRNHDTEERFRTYCERNHIDKCKYLFHGSLNENFWSIFSNGLSLNPNAKLAGKMFGHGLYFATNPAKSMRYTSLKGCNNVHWGIAQDTGLLAVYKVATGNPYHVNVWDPAMAKLEERSIKMLGYDSLWAHKGISLVNDEMIVYNEDACTIRYLLELM